MSNNETVEIENGRPVKKVKNLIIDPDRYPMMYEHAHEITPFSGKLVAKDDAIEALFATYEDPVVSNAILLAPPGTGKTTLMKGLAHQDKKHIYLEAELSEMITGLRDNAEMGSVVKNLFNEIAEFGKEYHVKIVIFVDEFHQLIDYSPVVAEAFKPVLAESGRKGLRLVVATTYEEFRRNIMPNQALTERLQRVSLPQPRYEDVINALDSLAKEEKISVDRRMRELFDTIYNVTEQYMPAANQPRKSVLTFSRMIGYHRAHKRKFGYDLLAYTLRTGQNIEIDMRVDLSGMEEYMRANIFDQDEAVNSFTDSVAMSVMKMNEDDKPRGSWLLLGPTGVGKALDDDTLIPTLNLDGEFVMKRNGDLTTDDYVFNRLGNPVRIKGVFPQGERQIYRFTFEDGRVVDASDEHLWTIFSSKQRRNKLSKGMVVNSRQILDLGLKSYHTNNRVEMKYYVPANMEMNYPEKLYDVDPYVVGAMLGNGHVKDGRVLEFSSSDEETVIKIASLLSASGYIRNENNYCWHFENPNVENRNNLKYFQGYDLKVDGLYDCLSSEKYISNDYKYGSVEQRWRLIQGLFDTDGSISNDDRYNVSYTSVSEQLVLDIQSVLWSLGVSSTISLNVRSNGKRCYKLHVRVNNKYKYKFFSLSRKLNVAIESSNMKKTREKTFDYVGIRNIEVLDETSKMTCIYIDDEEHLYQTANGIVTHNTELVKQAADYLFNDPNAFVRFDMTEYVNTDSVDRFRQLVTARLWEYPFSILLFDEIEKANGNVVRLLMQILDDGRLVDANDRVVNFSNAYIFGTSNLGSEIFESASQYGSKSRSYERNVKKSITETSKDGGFPPELVNRFDTIVPFNPLSRETMIKLLYAKARKLLNKFYKQHGVKVFIGPRVLDQYLGYDILDDDTEAGAGRQVNRVLRDYITKPVSTYIYYHPKEREVHVELSGQTVYGNKNIIDSTAEIIIVDADTWNREYGSM